MLVVVHGSYFDNNFGDTLLVKLICDEVALSVGKENVYLAVEGNSEEQQYIGYPVIPEKYKKDVSRIVYSGGGYLGESKGNYLQKIKWSLRNYKRHLAWLAGFPDANIGFFGTGYGPISTPFFRWKVNKIIKSASVVMFRDVESIKFYEQYGGVAGKAKLCTDYALSLKKEEVEENFSEAIGVHLPGLNEKEIKLIAEFVGKAGMADRKINVLLDNPNEKGAEKAKVIYSVLASHGCGNVEMCEYEGVDRLVGTLKECSLVITNKLHVGIVSIALGRKVISIPTHQKTIRLYRQLGIERFCIKRDDLSIDSLVSAYASLDEFRPNYDISYAGVNSIRQELKKFLSR